LEVRDGSPDHKEGTLLMANEKPTDETRVVPLDLSIERRLILRNEVESWLAGDREDLGTPDKLTDPERTRRRIATYERLIAALSRGKIALPDKEAHAALQGAADGTDDAESWEATKKPPGSACCIGPDIREAAAPAASGSSVDPNSAPGPRTERGLTADGRRADWLTSICRPATGSAVVNLGGRKG
jgi:hypothetical protein